MWPQIWLVENVLMSQQQLQEAENWRYECFSNFMRIIWSWILYYLLIVQENVKRIKSNEKGDTGDRVSLEDYNPIDPIPGGAKNVNPGPIEHGTPLMPFIPKSPPPVGESNPGPGDYN